MAKSQTHTPLKERPSPQLGDIGVLPEDVHSLFNRNNFRTCALDTPKLNWLNKPHPLRMRHRIKKNHYARMVPALQLASALITRATPFYARIAFGRILEGTLIDQKPSPEDIVCTTHALRQLSHVLRIFRSDSIEEDVISRAMCVNMAPQYLDPGRSSSSNNYAERPAVALILNAELFDFWTQPEVLWNDTSVFTKQVYSFELAVSMMHELAHAMWVLRSLQTQNLIWSIAEPFVRCFKEPVNNLEQMGLTETACPSPGWKRISEPVCSFTNPEPELGWACEEYVLGMITWGVFWKHEEATFIHQKTKREMKVMRKVGKAKMYFAPWVMKTTDESCGSLSKECEQAQSRQNAQYDNENGWMEFIDRYPAKVVLVDEEYLGKVFRRREML